MNRFAKAMGSEDEDVMNLQAGIAGLVFDRWTDEDIAAGVMEMVKEERDTLAEVMEKVRSKFD